MEFGPNIIVDGERPTWLTDDDLPLQWVHLGNLNALSQSVPAGKLQFWSCIRAIRLPADHFAYKALEAGFTPWLGGDRPPHDYSIGRVMFATGRISAYNGLFHWTHKNMGGGAIIGYESSKTVIGPLQYTKPHAVASKLFADILQRLGRPMIEPVDTFEGVMDQIDNLTSALVDRDHMHLKFIAILRQEGAHARADKLEMEWNLIDPLLIQARKLVDQHDDPVQAVYAALKGGDA